MKTIFCKTTDKGVQTFYLNDNGEVHYLFSQSYRVSVRDYFGKGLSINAALGAKVNCSKAVRKTAIKLVPYIKYIEKEIGIVVFDKINERKYHKRKNKPYNRAKNNKEMLLFYGDIA